MELSRVILKPYITEKTESLKTLSEKQVISLVVDPRANKNHIKQAFIGMFNVKPEKINIVNHKPAKIRTGTLRPGTSKAKKIAYIILPKGTKIALSKEEVEEAKEQLKDNKKK